MDRTRLYRNGVLEAEGFSVDEVSDHLADPSAVVWFDLCSPSSADLDKISEELGLHRLAVEDALHSQQRPKLDTYDSHLFLTVYGAKLVKKRLELIEISIFVTKHALVTVRENPHFDIDEVIRRWDANTEMAKYGVPYLLHGLLDYVVDGYFEVLQALDDQVEALEDDLFEEDAGDRVHIQRQTFEMRKKLVRFRRLAVPVREVVGSLLRRSVDMLDPALDPYYQDVYDHALRAGEWTDSLRELVGNIREAHINQQGFKLNDIMKRITSWAAIIAVPTMITGYYGQNVPYPGFGQSLGFWTSTAAILVASSILYLIFKKKGWL
ncbi:MULTISPECIES: magnesium transporter CorA family protein [Streptosporangium]|uniref:Magnesium transporter n=1 Tax=Streptosporangium brasiliense TaxID=47480 RepID=A0ABT9R383_9ACTN|nr:magnesium transporter CorA family protein [Streptosporangium brasiliense]MDP9863698.1 magnesium transporter [Streptosporangium brasiliense]